MLSFRNPNEFITDDHEHELTFSKEDLQVIEDLEKEKVHIDNMIEEFTSSSEALNVAIRKGEQSLLRSESLKTLAMLKSYSKDPDFKNIDPNNELANISVESIQSVYRNVKIAHEGLGNIIRIIMNKLKEWFVKFIISIKSLYRRINQMFADLGTKATNLKKKLTNTKIPPVLDTYKSQVVGNWLKSTVPTFVYIMGGDLGRNTTLRSFPLVLKNLCRRDIGNLQYPPVADLKPTSIKIYNENIKNYYESKSIMDTQGVFNTDDRLASLIRTVKNVDKDAIIKPYTVNSKDLYYFAIISSGNSKPVKFDFSTISIDKLNLDNPIGTEVDTVNQLFNNNLQNGLLDLCEFVITNSKVVKNKLIEIDKRIKTDSDKILNEISAFEDNTISDTTKALSSYATFVEKLIKNYYLNSAKGHFNVLSRILQLCSKVGTIAASESEEENQQ